MTNRPWHEVHVDAIQKELVSMESLHKRAHDGILFIVSHGAEAVADDSTLELLFIPSGSAHMRIRRDSDGSHLFTMFEDVTTSDDGTPLTPSNYNRYSSKTEGAAVSYTPTITDPGTQITSQMISGGVLFSDPTEGEEWILKDGLKYHLVMKNLAGSNATLAFLLKWYEPGQS